MERENDDIAYATNMLAKFFLHPMIIKNTGWRRVPAHVAMKRARAGE